jgi:hypothetical protein
MPATEIVVGEFLESRVFGNFAVISENAVLRALRQPGQRAEPPLYDKH